MGERRFILHADMDAFYASIEQRDNPELRGKPVIVGGESARGVVSAASYEARVFGVRSAMPGFRARELCPHGVFVKTDMRKYVAVSQQVHDVLAEFTPLIEPIALDEAFLDVSDSVTLFGGPLALARRLKARVREAVSLDVSVGLSDSKLVAKIACTFGKPNGLLFVPREAITWFLAPLPVRRIWGVGPVLGDTLERHGIRTVGDLARQDAEALGRAIGDRAHDLIARARGEDTREVESDRDPKSYGEENTFEDDVSDRVRVTGALTAHAEAVARRLRHDNFKGRTVTLKIKLGKARGERRSRVFTSEGEPNYPQLTRRRTLPNPTDDGAVIRRIAVELWDRSGVSEPVRLLGVSVSGLEASAPSQLDLFAERPRADRLGPALDRITARFGSDAIFRAVDRPMKASPTLRKKRGE